MGRLDIAWASNGTLKKNIRRLSLSTCVTAISLERKQPKTPVAGRGFAKDEPLGMT
jgi:hypothetical protein